MKAGGGTSASRASGRGEAPPSSARVSAQMARLGRRDTAPELALRRELHRRGLRFRVDKAPIAELRTRADVVFGPARVAVYVDGCFWHSCPLHGTAPKANEGFWARKLETNRARDRATDEALAGRGWVSIRVWEHESPVEAAESIERIVRSRARGGS